ncbi:MAG: segregation/condensation protein A [Nanoarchaeota archaeon]|nr:segregation/condensation protein A [Nanoarchaeota archaeon]
MDFKEFMPEKEDSSEESDELLEEIPQKISQNQFYDVITSRKPDWQAVIYELIYTEQLDPWDIDIVLLTRRYFEKIAELEEADFYISSKVLLAAALLLRIKSEYLLNKYIKSVDEILFGRKEDKKPLIERIQIDENELPLLIPKTPLPRLKKVTLNELITALNNAIETESRRIKREVAIKRAKKLSEIDFPSFRKIDLKDRIKQFYARILTKIKKNNKEPSKESNKVSYSNLVGIEKEEKLACFLPLLHLSNTRKLWLEQENHLEEIWIYLYEYFKKNKEMFIQEIKDIAEDILDEEFNRSSEILSEGRLKDDVMKSIEEAEKEASDELKNDISEEEIKEEIRKEILEEIEKDIDEISEEKDIDEITGFDEDKI